MKQINKNDLKNNDVNNNDDSNILIDIIVILVIIGIAYYFISSFKLVGDVSSEYLDEQKVINNGRN
ncbi:hypothetical protein CPIN17262_0490 [Campylobacter pinnipediorum subsp. pinnipediorum]|uniref:hypothetical protein n=1 Tax=Campylobacter pinnipediorum TaxID=1965231 RepID=UPI0009959BE0|nr:hypothetical protein [Campylobacter pinnipediorum]AQW84191.1 hypothetical protein CPIN17262_0490 [Campylobacter pinnipediorum subsp. pinnipediorum]